MRVSGAMPCHDMACGHTLITPFFANRDCIINTDIAGGWLQVHLFSKLHWVGHDSTAASLSPIVSSLSFQMSHLSVSLWELHITVPCSEPAQWRQHQSLARYVLPCGSLTDCNSSSSSACFAATGSSSRFSWLAAVSQSQLQPAAELHQEEQVDCVVDSKQTRSETAPSPLAAQQMHEASPESCRLFL